MTYQDSLDSRGRVVKAGSRPCSPRFDAIADHVRHGSTVLDLGAYAGYFSIRLANELGCVVTAADDYRPLAERCRGWPVTVIPKRLTVDEVDALGRFDVVLALSVLHHIPDWERMLDVLAANSDLLFVEPSNPAERLPKALAHCPELTAAVEALGGVEVCRTVGYQSTIERSTWLVT